MSKSRKVLSFILSVCLLISMAITIFGVFLNNKLMNSKFYFSTLEKESIIDEIYEDLQVDIKGTFVKNNIAVNNDDIENIITKQELSNLVKENIDNIIKYLKGSESKLTDIDCSVVTNKAINKFQKNMEEKSIIDNEAANTLISSIEKDIQNQVKTSVDVILLNKILHTSIGDSIHKIARVLLNFKLMIGIFIVDILLVSVMFFLKKSSAIATIGKTFMVVGIMFFATSLGGFLCKTYNNAPISPSYVQLFIGKIIEGAFKSLILYGIVIALIGLLFILIYCFKTNGNSYNE